MRRARFTRDGLLAMQPKAWGVDLEERGTADRGYEEIEGAAVVEIRGPLLSRAEGFLALFCDDYESIKRRVAAALESACARVILRIDSPGGDAGGCFELARELRAMAAAAKKPMIAYCEAYTCSAAYAIASAAYRIIAAPSAYVGSIGVFEPMVDWTAQTRAAGLNVVIVSSGEYKTDRNPDVPITDEAIARVQAQVDQFAQLFFDLVAELRGGAPDEYKALKGGVFLGSAALGVGLVDAVSGWGDVLAGEGSSMNPKAATKDPFQAAKDSLRSVVDDEKCSEEEREKARKSLRALEAEPEKKDGDGDNDGDAKAADEKKKDEEAKAKAAEDDKKKKDEEMKALASNATAMARELQELKAQVAEREAREAADKEARARADLFAKRPDFSDAQRATLAHVPLAELAKAVETWPRAAAAPGASANALVPGGAEPPKGGGYEPRLTDEERSILARCEPQKKGPAAAVRQGNVLVMPTGLTKEQARERLAQLEKEVV